ncbi:hypothetical protein DSL72_002944 [Monilinia vaccinii-corymbosi]|uniref:Kinetochore protein fta7 n=1 Tax=Monilinia vaccinii-corymbosi TaxID=61207 RepID=A0A8A3PE78_9HELO|nr:hypothetical protein DSL72_002944 [Monilinia vaccinii-corymbosi]
MTEERKRRRSRPSNWWEVQDNGSGNGDGDGDGDMARSQSRSPNTNMTGGGNTKGKARSWVPAGMGSPKNNEKGKRRGRASLSSPSTTVEQNGKSDVGEGNVEPEAKSQDEIRTRGGRKMTSNKRGILDGEEDIIEAETVTAVSSLAPKKKGRPAVGVVNHSGQDGQSRNAAQTAGGRKKGEVKVRDTRVEDKRRGKSASGNLETTNNQKKGNNGDRIEPEKGVSSRSQKYHQAEPDSSAPGHRAKKASENIEEPSQKQSSKPKKRVGISNVSQTIEPQAEAKNLGSPASSEHTKKRKDSNPGDQQLQKQSKRRRMDDSQDNRTEEGEPEPPSYRHLAAVTRRVSHETINTKWASLPPGCLDKISELMIDVQRPVVLQIRDERKKIQASTAIQMISRRLLNRVRKGMPFPKGTRTNPEDDFDFEKILDYNRALEAQLTPVLHSNDLLEAELRREEILLENEEKYLTELESNSKAEATSRRQAARKAHPLLQFEVDSTQKRFSDNIGIDKEAVASPITFNNSKYRDLEGIAKSINGHVDSIKGNLQQVEGMTEAMAKSKASVQAVLFNHLDLEQYNDVVLG